VVSVARLSPLLGAGVLQYKAIYIIVKLINIAKPIYWRPFG